MFEGQGRRSKVNITRSKIVTPQPVSEVHKMYITDNECVLGSKTGKEDTVQEVTSMLRYFLWKLFSAGFLLHSNISESKGSQQLLSLSTFVKSQPICGPLGPNFDGSVQITPQTRR